MEGEEERRGVLGKGSTLASPTSTGKGSVGEEPPAERYECRGNVASFPGPHLCVFACALKHDSLDHCCTRKGRKEEKGDEEIAEESCHTPTGLILRRKVMAAHQLLYNTRITKAPKVTAQTEMSCAG